MKRFVRLAILTVLLGAASVYGQEEGVEPEHETTEEAAAHEEAESPIYVAFKWVNFAVLFGALGYLLRKPAAGFFDSRKAEIGAGIERAKKAQAESEQRLSQIEQRLSMLSKDISNLRTESEQEAVVEKNKIVAEAQREVDRVVEQSRQEMERIAQGIEREIKEAVADVVIEKAAQKLQTKMTPDDQKRVVVRFIKNL